MTLHRIAPGVASAIVAKCFKARPATAAKAADACLLFVELEQHAPVVEAVLKSFSDKVPKVALAAVDVVARAVAEFGAPTVDPKPVIKALPAAYSHTNAGVRDRAKDLTVALAACTGAGVVEATLLEGMTDALRKDVEAAITARPERTTSPQRRSRSGSTRQRAPS
jgi:cytoskeleton-associated protein 5